ncbi:MAG: outer-membrane lipoprotein carrier protein LolA, partial [Gammaproteobacteria bacterium]|nr:outer-membrane lipoprotein carrier protein LolA [Gammaproteobacteria bacterium]
IRIGFEDNRLRLMELVDHLEQRTRIIFHEMKENIEIPDSRFQFIPPEGVDVIDEFELLDS